MRSRWNNAASTACVAHIAGKPETFGQTFNIAGPDAVTTETYYRLIAKQLGVELTYTSIPLSVFRQKYPQPAPFARHRMCDLSHLKRVAGFAARCGASMPAWLARRFDGLAQDQETTHLVAAAVAAEQVMDLVDQGIRQFHFYTLNRADLVYAICHLLGLRPEPVAHKEVVNA